MKKKRKYLLKALTGSSLLLGSITPIVLTTSCTHGEVTVRWLNWDNALLLEQKVAKGTIPQYEGKTPYKPDDKGIRFTFTSWDKELTPVEGDIEYKACFSSQEVKYQIGFKNWNGEILQPAAAYDYGAEVIYNGSVPSKPNDPDGTLYEFSGWDSPVTVATCDKFYVAQFIPRKNAAHVLFKSHDKVVQDTIVNWGQFPTYDNKNIVGQTYSDNTIDVFTGWGEIKPVPDQATTITYQANFVRQEVTSTYFTFKPDADIPKPLIGFSVENNNSPWIVNWGDGEGDKYYDGSVKQVYHKYTGSLSDPVVVEIKANKNISSISFDTSDFLESNNNNLISYMQLSNSINEIKDRAFNSCTLADQFVMPSNVCAVGNDIFGRNHIFKIVMPAYFRKIQDSWFESCNWLEQIELGGTQEVGDFAFRGCRIGSLTIPASLIKMTSKSFYLCDGGEEPEQNNYSQHIAVDPNNPVYRSDTTQTSIIERATGTILKGSAETEITDDIKHIADYAFYNTGFNKDLSTTKIETIGQFAFALCYYADEETEVQIKLPATLTSIGSYAFLTDATIITVDLSLTSEEEVVKGGDYMFNDASTILFPSWYLTIYVRASMYQKYINDPCWSYYFLNIEIKD